jgi:serine/threonine protein kinase
MLGFFARIGSLMQQSESSDVYSFGVFLLELISGREAAHLVPPNSKSSFISWVIIRNYKNFMPPFFRFNLNRLTQTFVEITGP